MSTIPTARPAPAGPIVASMDGHAKRHAHDRAAQRLLVTLIYRPDRPYDVNMVIAPGWMSCGHRPEELILDPGLVCKTCRKHLAPWLISREVLCSAAMWETPAGMGDFRATPMGESATQLVITDSNPAYRGESMHIDVARKELLRFLERTMRLVKPGRESAHIDMDNVITALLSSSRWDRGRG